MKAHLLKALALACLLAIPSVALKISRFQALFVPDKADEIKLMELLAHQRFSVERGSTPDNGLVIKAHRDTCDMELREVSALGWDRSTIKKTANGRDVFFIYDGDVFREQPAWRTWAYFHLRRWALFLGWRLPKRVTLAALSNGPCDGLDWRQPTARAFQSVHAASKPTPPKRGPSDRFAPQAPNDTPVLSVIIFHIGGARLRARCFCTKVQEDVQA